MLASFAGVGRKERPSREATLAPLTILCSAVRQYPCHSRLHMQIKGVLPLLGEVLWPLSGPERPLVSPTESGIVDGLRRSRCCRDGIGGAGLAQSAAMVARLLELAHAVLCGAAVSIAAPPVSMHVTSPT